MLVSIVTMSPETASIRALILERFTFISPISVMRVANSPSRARSFAFRPFRVGLTVKLVIAEPYSVKDSYSLATDAFMK